MEAIIDKTFTIEEPIEKVWVNLSNPMEIASCVPGASITEKIDETNFRGEVTLKLGPIKSQYAGQIELLELDEANHKMVLSGKGLDAKGKGSAEMTMNGTLLENENGTEVKFQMKVTIIGTLAQFGSRLINDVSDQMLNQFIGNFRAKLDGEEFDNSLSAGSMAGSILKSKIGGIFKGKKNT